MAPAAAQADKAKPKSSVPKIAITLTDGAVNSKTVSPTITTTFAPPTGTSAASACKGKVTVSVQVGTKTVKKKKQPVFVSKKSPLRVAQGICTAVSVLGLPGPYYGKTVKFAVKFPGNDAVKKFSKTSRLLIVVPPKVVPPPTPTVPTPTPPAPSGPEVHTKGLWRAVSNSDPSLYFEFTIDSDDFVHNIALSKPLTYTCPGHPAGDDGVGYPAFTAVENDLISYTNYLTQGQRAIDTTFYFSLGETTGTGYVWARGTLPYDNGSGGTDYSGDCSTGTITVTLQHIPTP